ncbi:MAG: hypothetical protein ACI91R_002501, partial [Vicingaceae bacterium]
MNNSSRQLQLSREKTTQLPLNTISKQRSHNNRIIFSAFSTTISLPVYF